MPILVFLIQHFELIRLLILYFYKSCLFLANMFISLTILISFFKIEYIFKDFFVGFLIFLRSLNFGNICGMFSLKICGFSKLISKICTGINWIYIFFNQNLSSINFSSIMQFCFVFKAKIISKAKHFRNCSSKIKCSKFEPISNLENQSIFFLNQRIFQYFFLEN